VARPSPLPSLSAGAGSHSNPATPGAAFAATAS
jgi:hypothetical protein